MLVIYMEKNLSLLSRRWSVSHFVSLEQADKVGIKGNKSSFSTSLLTETLQIQTLRSLFGSGVLCQD